MTASFGDIFTYDALTRMDVPRNPDSDTLKDRLFIAPLLDRLVALRAEGRLSPIKGSGNRKGTFLEGWNAFVADPGSMDEWDLKTLGHSLAEAFLSPLSNVFLRSVIAKIDREAAHEQAWREIVRRVDDGHLPLQSEDELFVTPGFRTKCQTTGNTVVVGMRDWSPVLHDFWTGEAVEDVEAPSIQHLTFEIEQGKLLVADHFRIDQFTDLVSEAKSDPNGASSIVGREQMTRDYLEQIGMVSVSVSNTSPLVFLRDGVIAIGTVDENGDDWQDAKAFADTALGRTCTDLWWVTMIERHRLVEIVARGSSSREEAESIVADYVRENDFVTEIDVTPGTYHLYFSGDDDARDKIFTNDVDLGRLETMFVLSPRELNLLAERNPSAADVGGPALGR